MTYDPRWADAIGQIESSNNYGALGPVMKNGDRAYGRYQVMGSNIPEWTQHALGYSMTPQEFLGNHDAQNAVFKNYFGGYADKYGNPQDAASTWFTGRPLAQGGNASDGYINGNTYVSRFNKALGNPQMASVDPNTTGALSPSAQLGPGAISQQGNTPWYSQLTPEGVSNGLIGAGAALASISSPSQGAAISGLLKKAGDTGSYSVHVDPKTGKGVRVNSKTGEVLPFQAFTPTPDDPNAEYNKATDKEDAKKMSDWHDKLVQAATDAANTGQSISQLRAVLQDPNLYQGTGGALHQQAAKLFSAMGFGDPNTAANGDVATALSNKLALQMMSQGGSKLLPGSFSDSDRAFVQQMSTSLNNSPAANQRLLDLMERANQRTMQLNQAASEYADAHGGRLDRGFVPVRTGIQNQWAKENAAVDKQYANSSPSQPSSVLPKGVKSIQIIQ